MLFRSVEFIVFLLRIFYYILSARQAHSSVSEEAGHLPGCFLSFFLLVEYPIKVARCRVIISWCASFFGFLCPVVKFCPGGLVWIGDDFRSFQLCLFSGEMLCHLGLFGMMAQAVISKSFHWSIVFNRFHRTETGKDCGWNPFGGVV